jgi:hypothetical protein
LPHPMSFSTRTARRTGNRRQRRRSAWAGRPRRALRAPRSQSRGARAARPSVVLGSENR